MANPLFEYLLRQGDTALVLGHRLSEWCGIGPALEEDIALANTALDFIGQTQMWLGYAAEVEGQGRSADDLAFRRDVWDFRNQLLVEQTNGDFAKTVMRQFLFDAFDVLNLDGLQRSGDPRIAEIAAKSVKEARYHLERSRETVIALGDGTAESNSRMQAALNILWPFTAEMLTPDPVDQTLADRGITPDLTDLSAKWQDMVQATLSQATLTLPNTNAAQSGGKTGARHSEHLGHMLATMQFLPRAYPDARW